jgi:predicted metalloprotease with PDZ domain
LGLRVKEMAGSSIVTHVLRHSCAERWGLQAGDEIWSVTVGKRQWRVRTLQDIYQALPRSGKWVCHIVRDREVLSLQATWPLKPDAGHMQTTLSIENESRVQEWLTEKA